MANEQTSVQTTEEEVKSYFTGGVLENLGIKIVSGLVCMITLGIAYPFMLCWRMRWECEHTYVNGKQLVFDGKGGQLFGNYIKWILLSIITLGIYYILCVAVSMEKWKTKHTHFVGEENGESEFDGNWLQNLGVGLLTGFVTLITLTLGMYWAHCYSMRWLNKHKVIDGQRLYFDGKALQYFCKCIVWSLLTIITLGIYSFWVSIKSMKWHASHTHIEENV